jgi:hypothetical protein
LERIDDDEDDDDESGYHQHDEDNDAGQNPDDGYQGMDNATNEPSTTADGTMA